MLPLISYFRLAGLLQRYPLCTTYPNFIFLDEWRVKFRIISLLKQIFMISKIQIVADQLHEKMSAKTHSFAVNFSFFKQIGDSDNPLEDFRFVQTICIRGIQNACMKITEIALVKSPWSTVDECLANVISKNGMYLPYVNVVYHDKSDLGQVFSKSTERLSDDEVIDKINLFLHFRALEHEPLGNEDLNLFELSLMPVCFQLTQKDPAETKGYILNMLGKCRHIHLPTYVPQTVIFAR